MGRATVEADDLGFRVLGQKMEDEPSTPEDSGAQAGGQQATGGRPRAIVLEESLRGATALSAVVFGLSVLTALPVVDDWMFAAALAGVLMSVPVTVSVRLGQLRSPERSLRSLWHGSLLGWSTLGLVVALLGVMARATDLATALTRLGAVLLVVALMACLRGWNPRPAPPAESTAPSGE